MSSDLDQLDQLIQVGHDITSHKYYAIATGTILFYDYLLTLGDEIKYAWFRNKSWTFWLFIANRYFPMTYQFWQIGLAYTPQSRLNTIICDNTSWYSLFTFTVCTLLAQVVLTLRIYAVTMKNIPVALGFASITLSQLALGICMTTLAAMKGAQPLPAIPLDAYHLCVFHRHRPLEVAYTSISLLYDTLAFLLIIFLAVVSEKRDHTRRLRFPTILGTIAEDATRYFLVIFTAHLAFELTLNLGPEDIQLLPGTGVVVYLPVMISRIMLSLRKAADEQQSGWSLGVPTMASTNFRSIKFLQQRRGPNGGRDDIPLDTLPYLESQMEIR